MKTITETPVNRSVKWGEVSQQQCPNPNFISITDILQHRAQTQPDKTAFIFLKDGEDQKITLTYKELDTKARAIAAVLQRHRLENERVLLIYPAGIDFIPAFFGCLYAGAIAVPAYPPKKNRSIDRLVSILNNAAPKIALTNEKVLSKLNTWIDTQPTFQNINWIASDSLNSNLATECQPVKTEHNRIAFLQYTSGSTSQPKGVMISHGNLIENEKMIQEACQHNDQSVLVGWAPLFHDLGLICNMIQPIFAGFPAILMPPIAFLQKPIRWLKAISTYRATTSGSPDFGYALCADKIDSKEIGELDLSSWKIAFNGSEPIHAHTIQSFYSKFHTCGFSENAVYPCYGLAETTLFVTGNMNQKGAVYKTICSASLKANKVSSPNGNHSDHHLLVSSGIPWHNETIKIVDPKTKNQLSHSQIGEIWVKGKHVGIGYWNNSKATEATFKARIKDSGDGPFLRTGDLGFQDENGYIYITGRCKELIVIRGKNYYPQDIELAAESSHKGIRTHASAAFSIAQDDQEKLVIVLEIERNLMNQHNYTDLFHSISKTIGEKYEIETHAIVLIRPGSFPKTSSGKIQRLQCKSLFLKKDLRTVAEWRKHTVSDDHLGRQITLPRNSFETELVLIWKSILELDTVCVHDDFFALGGNSLVASQVQTCISDKFGIEIALFNLFETTTIESLAKLIETKQVEFMEKVTAITTQNDLDKMFADFEETNRTDQTNVSELEEH